MNAQNQFFRKSFFLIEQGYEQLADLSSQKNHHKSSQFEKNNMNNSMSNSQKLKSKSIRHDQGLYSLKASTNQLRDGFKQIQQPKQKRQRRYLSTIDKRHYDSSFDDVSPWNATQTYKQITHQKQDFTKEREKIKQMIHQYRLNKTIQESNKQHANFIKGSKSKKKKINLVLLQYGEQKKTFQKPFALIRSVDVNKSYENYLNNELNFDKNLFKNPTKTKSYHKKQISSSRLHSKQSQNDRDFLKQRKIPGAKEDRSLGRYLEELRGSLSKQNLLVKQNDKEMSSLKKKIYEKAMKVRNQRNKKGLRKICLRQNGQGDRFTSEGKLSEGKVEFSISGNKTHKLQYQRIESSYQ